MPYSNRSDVFKDKYFKLIADKPCRTITAHMKFDCHSYIHPFEVRPLTPRESARIQSFPDDYFFFYLGDGRYKAVTIGIGVQFAVYDMAGRLVLFQTLPTADPADVEVDVDQNGNQILRSALPSADGVVFDAKAGQPYFYVFFDTKTKRIEKGGKFEWK